jgi:hypothetical protein
MKRKGTMMIRNMTPHVVTVLARDGKTVIETFPSEGNVRLATKVIDAGTLFGNIPQGPQGQHWLIPITEVQFGKPEGLPPMQDGVWLIVSQIVKSAIHRSDMLVPAELVRDADGVIIGCMSLSR